MSSGVIETGLSKEAINVHRALASLQEEMEAIDYYHQRADVTDDGDLKAMMLHNRNDEMEHAMMLLEWLRRAIPGFDIQMKTFLFTLGSITELAGESKPAATSGAGLGLGNLK